MTPRVLGALAVADFRERVRRPGYAVVLMAAVGLGYLAAPAAGAHWTIVNSGAYRGVYNSAYIGTVTGGAVVGRFRAHRAGRARPGNPAGAGRLARRCRLHSGARAAAGRAEPDAAPFQAVYLPLWYAAVNDIAALDYMGALAGGPPPAAVGAAVAALLTATLSTVAFRHARR